MRRSEPAVDHSERRSRGSLLGLAVGDALGTTNEFRKPVTEPFPKKLPGPQLDMMGGGPFKVKRGQVTDDTHMACCLAASLRDWRAFQRDDVARRYIAWSKRAFDIGRLTHDSLRDIAEHRFVEISGKRQWILQGKKPSGNGSLMRTAPIGVFFARQDEARLDASLADSAITHFDPRCQLACAAFNAAIASCIRGPTSLDKQAVLESARVELTRATTVLARQEPDFIREVKDASAVLRRDLELATMPDPDLFGIDAHLFTMMGFVRVAFRLAFWELLHTDSFEEALIDVVNRGGDADTNGAITGALLGAFYGDEAIPERWAVPVLEALPGDHGPFGTLYHPRDLVTLRPK